MKNKPMCFGDTHVWLKSHGYNAKCLCGKEKYSRTVAEVKEDINIINKATHFMKGMEGKLCQ